MSQPILDIENRIAAFEKSGLGLKKDGSVSLSEHNSRWTREFSKEAHFIFESLQISDLRLYHIGSTSIPEIHAKPIIDILIVSPTLELLDSKKLVFEKMGYEYKGEYGLKGRRYSVLYNSGKNKSYVHLHAYEENDPEIEQLLMFRDFLRKNSDQAKLYENLKFDLVEKQKVSRASYVDMKASLIQEMITKARTWKESYKPRRLILLGSAKGGHQTEDWLLSQQDLQDSEMINLYSLIISPYSYKNQYPANDSFLTVVDKIVLADIIVIASPVYWYSPSAHVKLLLDRLTDLISAHKDRGRQLYGKSIELMATGSDVKAPIGFDLPINLTSLYFGIDYLGIKYKCTDPDRGHHD